MSDTSQMRYLSELEPPEKPPDKPTGSGTRPRKHVTRACNGCRTTKQRCDGKNPCQTCQSKGLVCDYDSASDPGDRRKLRASARQYNELLQQRAVLDDLCHAIRLNVADEALQRIREGASPLDVAELLNSVVRNSISESSDFPSVPHGRRAEQEMFQQALESNTHYSMPWYDDRRQSVPTNTHSELQQADPTSSFSFTTDQTQDQTATEPETASWQVHSTWNPSIRDYGADSGQLSIRLYEGLDMTPDFLQQYHSPQVDAPDRLQEESNEDS